MYISENAQGDIYLDDMHSFWNILWQIKDEDTNDNVRHANADDKRYFQSLMDKVLKADPNVAPNEKLGPSPGLQNIWDTTLNTWMVSDVME